MFPFLVQKELDNRDSDERLHDFSNVKSQLFEYGQVWDSIVSYRLATETITVATFLIEL